MKLYFSPGACSLSPHIVLREAGMTFDIEKVNLAAKTTASGADFNAINPKGYIPALALDSGDVLTEGPAIVQYIADQNPGAGLAPANGTLERYRLIELLNFISTEVHKGFSPLFNPKAPDATKALAIENLKKRFAYVDGILAKQDFIAGSSFSVADAYLFTVSGWAKFVNLDLSGYTHLSAYLGRIAQRPAVHAAMVAEGLIKE